MFQARSLRFCVYVFGLVVFGSLVTSSAKSAWAENTGSFSDQIDRAAWQKLETIFSHRSANRHDSRMAERNFPDGEAAWSHHSFHHGHSAWAHHDFHRGRWNDYHRGPSQFARYHHRHGNAQFAWQHSRRHNRWQDGRNGPPQFAHHHHHRHHGESQYARGNHYRGDYRGGPGPQFAQRGFGPPHDRFAFNDGPAFTHRGFRPEGGFGRPDGNPTARGMNSMASFETRLDRLDKRLDALLNQIDQMHHEPPQK